MVVESDLSFGMEKIKRLHFPQDFLFGASTAAPQIEGATDYEGRGPSIWDKYTKEYTDRMRDHSNMDTAIDSYRRFKEDLKVLRDLGVDAYRFSISWTRIFPNGSLSGGINRKGIDHYNELIDTLVEYGIKPFVTLLHFDSPQALQDKYGGFLSRSIIDDFKDYCEVCFETFGDRVKHWITINEPLMIAQPGYDIGIGAPGRCSNKSFCLAGNSSTEPYIVSHNILLSHSSVVKLYREKYQATQGGEIGISHVGQYYEPYSESEEDKAAQARATDFELGWYMDPLVYGDYPSIMRTLVKNRLPAFTEEEKDLVKGSFDFIGINYYTSRYAKAIPIDPNSEPISFTHDEFVNATEARDGTYIGPKAEGIAIYIYPQGLQKLLEYIKQKYQNPNIYITENGITEKRDDKLSIYEALDDQHRIGYIRQHLHRILNAIKNGVTVKGYFYWSLFDSLEWLGGYTIRFGLYYIDYSNDFKRIPKLSANWYRKFLREENSQAS